MSHDLYRARCVDEEDDIFIAHLTDIHIKEPYGEQQHPGAVVLKNGTLYCRSETDLEGSLSSNYEYFLIDAQGERFPFSVSRIGQPLTKVDGRYQVRIY